MNVHIPQAHQDVLRQWFKEDAQSAAKIEAAILNAMPSTTIAGFGKQLASALEITEAEGSELSQVFISMAASFGDIPVDRRAQFPQAVVDEVFDDSSPPNDAVARLERLLAARPLLESAKALGLSQEWPQIMHDCRIITDLRPIFGEGDIELRAFTITHQLRIGFETGSESSDFFVALDASDLRKLRAAIERALSKQASLETFPSRLVSRLSEGGMCERKRMGREERPTETKQPYSRPQTPMASDEAAPSMAPGLSRTHI